MKKLVTLSLAALLLRPTAVMAQDQAAFDSLDSDGDDKLSFSDLVGAVARPDPGRVRRRRHRRRRLPRSHASSTAFRLRWAASTSTCRLPRHGVVTAEVDSRCSRLLDSDGDDKLSFDDLTGLRRHAGRSSTLPTSTTTTSSTARSTRRSSGKLAQPGHAGRAPPRPARRAVDRSKASTRRRRQARLLAI